MPTPEVNEEMNTSNLGDREKMKQYWVKHSQMGNLQEMLLDSNAEEISDHELPEILSILPSIKTKKVLELGAGIGRFTRMLAQKAENVIAVDFIEKFIQKNRELNSDLNNIQFITGDVTKLTFESNSFHTIFSNWLLMYLKDQEVLDLIEKSLYYLEEGGYLFFRESCFHASGNIKKVDKNDNPTEYRAPFTYLDFCHSKTVEINGVDYGYELVFARPSRTYIEMKNNGNQVCFLFQKVKLATHHGFKTIKEFFDHKQYTTNGILRYEKIFGAGFVSTGGKETTEKFLDQLELKPNQRVLDIGCGIGGADFLMSQKFGVEVFGLDLSSNMISICWDRLQTNKNLKCRFEIGDATKHDFPNNYFDVIYSRDAFLHIPKKRVLFAKLKNWLKPGGKLFISDYTCGPKPWSDEFTCYVEQRGYDLLTIKEYEDLLNEFGFINIRAEDKTDFFIEYTKKELNDFIAKKDEFVKEFSMSDYVYISEGWKEKLIRCNDNLQKYGTFLAEKKNV